MAGKKEPGLKVRTDDGDMGAETADILAGIEREEEPRSVKFIVNLTPSVYSALMGACDAMKISASGKLFELAEEWTRTPEAQEAKDRYEAYNGGPYKAKSRKKA